MIKTKKQKNCKICQSFHSTELLSLYHVHHFTYRQIAAYFKKHFELEINQYNVNCHLQRHIEESDIAYVEKYEIISEAEAQAELA